MSRRKLIIFITLLSAACAFGAETGVDSVATEPEAAAAPHKRNIIQRIIAYFDESNKPKKYKKLDFSVIGGPYYSSDSKFGIGIVAAGIYNLDKADSLWLNKSNSDLYFNATTAAHFKVGLRGENIFPADRSRISYDVAFHSIETKFWGIGYDMCSDDNNESKYRYLAIKANAAWYFRIFRHIYIGPLAIVDYINGRKFQRPEMWTGLPAHSFNWGPGVSLRVDTRDCITEPHRGVFLRMDQWFSPRWLGNSYPFSASEFTAAWYKELWRGGVVASRLHWRITWGDTPWGAMSGIGGSDNMRGYFEDRYRDKSEIDLCVELRQRVWRRNGIVVWGGAASVFPRFSAIRFREILPNFGFGYRWEFKQRTNLRVDFGFGRHQSGFIFNINEAF